MPAESNMRPPLLINPRMVRETQDRTLMDLGYLTPTLMMISCIDHPSIYLFSNRLRPASGVSLFHGLWHHHGPARYSSLVRVQLRLVVTTLLAKSSQDRILAGKSPRLTSNLFPAMQPCCSLSQTPRLEMLRETPLLRKEDSATYVLLLLLGCGK